MSVAAGQRAAEPAADVMRCADLPCGSLRRLFTPWGLKLALIDPGRPIPGSFWGEPEAGLIADTLYLRPDTPVHSALHEGCHWICMPPERRARLHTDAGGSQIEENAACCLQIMLANRLPGVGRERMCRDMDRWGYTFRLGSAAAWFARDAQDAFDWLQCSGILTAGGRISRPVHGTEE